MRTYAYRVAVEPDEGGWRAYCHALRSSGAVTRRATESEAYRNINEVVRMIVDEMLDEKTLPDLVFTLAAYVSGCLSAAFRPLPPSEGFSWSCITK